jgi:hypothetical protein
MKNPNGNNNNLNVNGTSKRTIDSSVSYILKRMHIIDRPNIEFCAKREIYFGEHLANATFVARYVDHFTTTTDYWLVFRDEGVSLQQVCLLHGSCSFC